MREILFRGKTYDEDWVHGYYVRLYNERGNEANRIYLGYSEMDCGDFYPDYFEIVPETVGQYTGLTDKNGTKIFEGDIVKAKLGGGAYKGFEWPCADVQYQKASFGININKDFTPLSSFAPTVEFEVIGNIHDVAERLEV